MTNLQNNNSMTLTVERTISAFQQGVGRRDFKSKATTYGTLKQELKEQGFSLVNTKVSEGHTYISLEQDDAILPTNITVRGAVTNDLIILISPETKPKSGAIADYNVLTRNELYALIQVLRKSPYYKESAETLFANYTIKSNAELRELLAFWDDMTSENYADGAQESEEEDAPEVSQGGRMYYESLLNDVDEDEEDEDDYDEDEDEEEDGEFKAVSLLEVLGDIFGKLKDPNAAPASHVQVSATINKEAYFGALETILRGLNSLQNTVLPTQSPNLPSDEELERMMAEINR